MWYLNLETLKWVSLEYYNKNWNEIESYDILSKGLQGDIIYDNIMRIHPNKIGSV